MSRARAALVAVLRTRPVTAFLRRWIDTLDRLARRATGGRFSFSRLFFPELVLYSRGARSGLWREHTLLYVEHEGVHHIVGTNFGGDTHPGWTFNLLANPAARTEVAGEHHEVTAEQLTPDEMAELWPRFDEVYPGYAGYREAVGDRRAIRMFRLLPR